MQYIWVLAPFIALFFYIYLNRNYIKKRPLVLLLVTVGAVLGSIGMLGTSSLRTAGFFIFIAGVLINSVEEFRKGLRDKREKG